MLAQDSLVDQGMKLEKSASPFSDRYEAFHMRPKGANYITPYARAPVTSSSTSIAHTDCRHPSSKHKGGVPYCTITHRPRILTGLQP